MLPLKSGAEIRHSQYQDVKARVHEQLLGRLNLERLSQVRRTEAEPEIRSVIASLLEKEAEKTPLSLYEREAIIVDVLNELFGLGPLEALLVDPEISDILVNRFDQIYIEKNGVLEPVSATFRDDRHLMRIIERIVSTVGRRIDESSPMVDARLLDGSRVNAVIPPLSIDGPVLSIRRFRTDRVGAQDLVRGQSLTQPMLTFLKAAVSGRLNIVVSGGTGAGKTTLLNILSGFISDRERSSRSRTPPNSCSGSGTSSGSKRARRTSKARARCGSGSSSSMPSVCGPTASSSARSAATKRWTCCRR